MKRSIIGNCFLYGCYPLERSVRATRGRPAGEKRETDDPAVGNIEAKTTYGRSTGRNDLESGRVRPPPTDSRGRDRTDEPEAECGWHQG